MKKMICCTLAFLAFNAFASTIVIASKQPTQKTMKQEIATVDSLIVAQNEETKELIVKGNNEKAIDMKNVAKINFRIGKNDEDKISFYINGDKRTYKLSDIKAIKVRTIERN